MHFELVFFIEFHCKIMTAVASQQQLPKLINEMPPGNAKEIVMQLQGKPNRYN